MKHLFLLLFVSVSCYSTYGQNTLNEHFPNENFILIGEYHSVAEKYEGIQSIVFNRLSKDSSINTFRLFVEMPYSFRYVTNRLLAHNDTTLFKEYFNHIYEVKNEKPIPAWIEEREMLLAFKAICEEKNIELNIVGVNRENFNRTTVFVLQHFVKEKNANYHLPVLDSLVNARYISNSKPEAKHKIKAICQEIKQMNLTREESQFIDNIMEGLVNCFMCIEREQFMVKNFLSQYKYDEETLTVGVLGLGHLVQKRYNVMYKNPENAFDYIIDSSIVFDNFMLSLPNSIRKQAYVVAITPLYRSIFFNIEVEIIGSTPEELLFLHKEIGELHRKVLITRDYPELKNYTQQVDHLILYKESNYKLY